MSDWIQVSETQLPAAGTGIAVRVEEISVAVFRDADQWYAVEDRCPHQGAILSDSTVEDGTITCSRHGWKFGLQDGRGLMRPNAKLRRFAVRVEDGHLFVSRTPIDADPEADATTRPLQHRYLVRYGCLGWVGVFESETTFAGRHRAPVVVRTDRGEELGEFLNAVSSAAASQQALGTLVREAAADDVLSHATSLQRVPSLIHTATRIVQERSLSIDVVDAELLLKDELAVVYYLGEFAPDFAALRTELAIEHGIQRVDLVSLIEPEPTGGGCGSGGCGDGGGSCCSH